jgi:serine/threonine protein kinase
MNQPSLWERLAERQQSPSRPASRTTDAAPAAQHAAPARAPAAAGAESRDFAAAGAREIESSRSPDVGSASRLIGRRYRLGERIGRGKFGPIYAATDEGRRDLGIEGRVAVQLIDERYARDTRVAAELTSAYSVLSANVHPNIVRTIEFVRDGRTLFLVMELLEGLSLDAVLDEVAPEPLPFDEAAAVLTAVGDALRNLHAKGFVYGPLKLKNVFVTFEYGVKLLDVAPVSPPVSVPYYVEDVGKQPIGRHTTDDVFELACLVYQMLSGRHPFNENSPIEAQRAGLEPQPLAEVGPQRWQAIARGLALKRADRTHTVQRFLEELAIRGNERIRTTQRAGAAPAASPAPSTAPSPFPSDAKRTWQATRRPNGELGELDTMPLRARPRRRSAAGPVVRSLFGIAVVVTLGGIALLYYGDLRNSAAELLALVEQKLPAQRAASPVNNAGPTDAATGPGAGTEMPQPTAPHAAPSPAPVQAPAAAATPGPETTPPAASARPGRAAETTPPAASQAQASSSSAGARTSPPASTSASTPNAGSNAGPAPSTASRAPAVTGESPAAPRTAEPGPASRSASTATPPEGAQATAPPATRPPAAGAPTSAAQAAAEGNRPATAASEESAGLRVAVAGAAPQRSTTDPVRPASPSIEFPFAFVAPTITVSERDKLARIEVRRLGPTDIASSVVWWLGNATASEDDDYGKLGQHTEFFARGEQSRTLYVPLIDDKDQEPTESFYVYLGRYSPLKKHLDALASVRIDIVDDD